MAIVDTASQMDQRSLDLYDTVRQQLEWMGENPDRPGLRDTPRRVIEAWQELTCGMREDPSVILSVTFEEPCDEMIVLRDIPFWSLCEHHILPFHGTATVGYIPRSHIVVGLSKLARLVKCFSRRLQTQERMTWEIARALHDTLMPIGTGVVVQASHTCMAMRGIEKSGTMVTSALLGSMRNDSRQEFLSFANI